MVAMQPMFWHLMLGEPRKYVAKGWLFKKWAMKKLGLLVVLVIQGMKYYIIYTFI